MINKDTIDRIFEAANIEEVIGDFVKLNKKGANYTCCCPFHDEKTPSFSVSPTKGIFKCFGCGKGGDAVSFIMEYRHKSFPEAIKYLANKYHIIIQEGKANPEIEKKAAINKSLIEFNEFALKYYIGQLKLPENKAAHNYISSRFSKETINQFQIGAAPNKVNGLVAFARAKGYKDEFLLTTGLIRQSEKNHQLYDFFRGRVIFPLHDRYGRIISFSGRLLPGDDNKYGKYMNGPETNIYKKSNVLYGLNHALTPIVKTKTAILVEGNPDVIRLHQIGIANAVAPLGTALSLGQIKLLSKFAKKIILLYDGDSAGNNAAIKSGKILVENGLIPYAAILPKGEDPDTFFTSEEQFYAWIDENKKEYISWYANSLLKNIGEDPALKNEAIAEVCNLLICLDITSRDLSIDNICKTNKLRSKFFTDKLKELEATKRGNQKTETFVPNGVDVNDFEKRGFYDSKNAYYFRTKDVISKYSNFIMKPVFHIDSIIDSKRIFELVNEHGYRVVVNLDMSEMTSLQGFQRNIESKGNFMFWGQMSHFQKLKLKLYEETRTCVEIKNLGWQKEDFWAWSNGLIDSEGKFVEIDEYGVVRFSDRDYFIPAFSKIYLKDKSIFLDERKFQYKSSDVSLQRWMDLYLKVHGENAIVGFAWYLSALFRDHILYLHDNFPMLNLFGQKGSGKNTLAYSLLSLFGKKQTEFNIHNGTKPGLAKHLEMFRNAIAFVDEYKNNLDFDKIETLKSIYNAIGRSRLNMDKGGKKEVTEVNQGVIVAGQEMPTIDVALSSRMIFLQFLSKEGLSREAKQNFEMLQEMERDGLPHLTVGFLKHRKYFIEYYKENYEDVMHRLTEDTSNEEIDDRLIRNICAVVAAFKTLEPKFKFSFTFNEVYKYSLKITRDHNGQIKQSDELGIFWNMFETLDHEDRITSGWDFRIDMLTTLTVKGNSNLNWPAGKQVLRFNFRSIAKKYSEELSKTHQKPLREDSLLHYLKSNKAYIGNNYKCNFSRKIFKDGEYLEEKKNTSALCFDYEMLKINLVSNLTTEGNGSSHYSPPDASRENNYIETRVDNLDF